MLYRNNQRREITFPLGGIGTGSVGLNGDGSFQDWEIFGSSDKGSINGHTHLAIRAETDERTELRVLCTDPMKELTGRYKGARTTEYGNFGFGPNNGAMYGFPHFRDSVFDGRFPCASILFRDESFPGEVRLNAWSPFIPLNSDDSSLPVMILEVEYRNTTDRVARIRPVFSLTNPFPVSRNRSCRVGEYPGVTLLNAASGEDSTKLGDLTAFVLDAGSSVQQNWYRGAWQDPVVMFWNEFSAGTFSDRTYDTDGEHDTCSLYSDRTAAPGSAVKVSFCVTWSVPFRKNTWDPCYDADGHEVIWKNWYATRFADSKESAEYVASSFDRLRADTFRFRDLFHAQDLDPTVIDAASANLSVLRTPTVLRLEDGSLYGWEGLQERVGSCEGSCQHVWAYTYAMCYLFPDLERSMRENEVRYCLKPSGYTNFRFKLPPGRDMGSFRSCVDGQMSVILRIYREWKISGDDAWMERMWPSAYRMLAWAWSKENPDEWDRDRDGYLEGRQHHTLDMELFGPSSWLEGFYLAALKAASEMAGYLGKQEIAGDLMRLFRTGKARADRELFNGKWFIQRTDLHDHAIMEHFGCEKEYWNAETKEIKYQIAEGCEIDQLCGQWHADLLGLGEIFDRTNELTALRNLYRNNYKPSLRSHVNPWRLFALGDEAASIICTYPEGTEKPSIPVPYCEEAMTGFEYQMAGSLLAAGLYREGLDVVRGVRGRFDGEKRNPWNEFECGSNYARSMASFALIPILCDLKVDLPSHRLGFGAKTPDRKLSAFFSLGTAWGILEHSPEGGSIRIERGYLELSALSVGPVTSLTIDDQPFDFRTEGDTVLFGPVRVTRSVTFTLKA